MARVICLILGYALGLIQTGYLVGKAKGIDIRNYGSKNAGTTNVLRTMGAKYGALVLLGDALKCIVAVLITKAVFISSYPDTICLLMLYSAAGVILGHNFPFYMNFKGGKGIAATAGLAISYFFSDKKRVDIRCYRSADILQCFLYYTLCFTGVDPWIYLDIYLLDNNGRDGCLRLP